GGEAGGRGGGGRGWWWGVGTPFLPSAFRLLACRPHHRGLSMLRCLSRARRPHGGAGMKGDPQVIDGLNRALTIELTAINQYFCQAKMCKNWGFHKLAAKHYEESLGEMKHA